MDVDIPTHNCNACGGKQWPLQHGQQVVDVKDCQGVPTDYPADEQGNPTATPRFILQIAKACQRTTLQMNRAIQLPRHVSFCGNAWVNTAPIAMSP
jgi:hypothetical protein